MRFFITSVLALMLPQAFAYPPQNEGAKGEVMELAIHDPYELQHDTNLMLKRGVHPSCVTCMAACLASMNYEFVFGKTFVPKSWAPSWALCGVGCLAKKTCFGSNTATIPEYGIMMQEIRGQKLTDNDCPNIDCNVGDDTPCESLGCSNCFQPAAPPGPMPPPPAPARCAD